MTHNTINLEDNKQTQFHIINKISGVVLVGFGIALIIGTLFYGEKLEWCPSKRKEVYLNEYSDGHWKFYSSCSSLLPFI